MREKIKGFLPRGKNSPEVPEEGLPVFSGRKKFIPGVDTPESLDEAIAAEVMRTGKMLTGNIVPASTPETDTNS